jgi:hypothetical protein
MRPSKRQWGTPHALHPLHGFAHAHGDQLEYYGWASVLSGDEHAKVVSHIEQHMLCELFAAHRLRPSDCTEPIEIINSVLGDRPVEITLLGINRTKRTMLFFGQQNALLIMRSQIGEAHGPSPLFSHPSPAASRRRPLLPIRNGPSGYG